MRGAGGAAVPQGLNVVRAAPLQPTSLAFGTRLAPSSTPLARLLWGPQGAGAGRAGWSLRTAVTCLSRPLPRSFTQAMLSQPRMQSLDNPLAYRVGLALLGVGGVFVLSSFLALGFTGTFLGKTPRAGGRGPATTSSRPPLLLQALVCPARLGRPGSQTPSSCLAARKGGISVCCVRAASRSWRQMGGARLLLSPPPAAPLLWGWEPSAGLAGCPPDVNSQQLGSSGRGAALVRGWGCRGQGSRGTGAGRGPLPQRAPSGHTGHREVTRL